MLSFNPIAEKVMKLFVIAQQIQRHECTLRVFGL